VLLGRPVAEPEPTEQVLQVSLGQIQPNPWQPRSAVSQESLQPLVESIRANGILQPIVLRKRGDGHYELVAGERRWRAAGLANLTQIPAVVRDVADNQMLLLALLENIQRENLNPIEEAEAYHRLITQLTLTQEQAAARVGKSRSAVANFLRLRQLPDPVKESIAEGKLSMGHARALLGTENAAQQLAAWRTVVARSLSVRQTEELVRRLKAVKKAPRVTAKGSETAYLTSLTDELSRSLGTKVSIRRSGRQGRLEIEFYNNDDLDRLITRLRQLKA